MKDEILEAKIAKLERILLGKNDSLAKDMVSFSSNIESASDLLRDALELWYEGLVLSPSSAASVKADLTDIITMSRRIMKELI